MHRLNAHLAPSFAFHYDSIMLNNTCSIYKDTFLKYNTSCLSFANEVLTTGLLPLFMRNYHHLSLILPTSNLTTPHYDEVDAVLRDYFKIAMQNLNNYLS
jgi:hypothetical protein